MAKYRENDCVGCDDCVHCGRNHWYYAFNCDECGEYIDPEDVRNDDGKDYCPKCYQRLFEDDLK